MPEAAVREPDGFRTAASPCRAAPAGVPEGSTTPAHGPSGPTARRTRALGCPHDAHGHARTGPIRSEYTVGDTTVLELRGDLDIAVTPIVTARLDVLTAYPRPDLVVDLCPVPFLDCSALGALCRACMRTRERHGRLRLVSDSGRLRTVLRHTGSADAFEVHRSLANALRCELREDRPA